MPAHILVLRYSAFAAIAIGMNVATQYVQLRIYRGPGALMLAMIVGTSAGLLTKYLLDKHWIFYDQLSGWRHNARTFFRYAAIGLATTAMFWCSELLFDWISSSLRLVGALVGLALGYWIKFCLDRRFVFVGAV
jgi:putative flippase GtrA